MSLIDLILNLAGLILWLVWRSLGGPPAPRGAPGMLSGTLQRAESKRRGWKWPAGLAALLVFRGVLYRQIGSAVNWTPSIPLGAIVVAFRSDLKDRILLFSLLSFLVSLGILYSGLLLLSLLNSKLPDNNPTQRWVRSNLGRIDRFPAWLKLLLPWLVLTAAWLAVSPLLSALDIIPAPRSAGHLLQQAAVIGLGSYFSWKYVVAGVLLLHIVNSYVYLGNDPFWSYLGPTAKTLSRPLGFLPLRAGKLDFAPVCLMIIVFFLCEAADRGLSRLYAQLPLF
jgi:hypothetical protein